MALGRKGYTDWVGVTRGRGRSLEIAVYAVRLDSPDALTKAVRRSGAPASSAGSGLDAPRGETLDRLLGFAEGFRR